MKLSNEDEKGLGKPKASPRRIYLDHAASTQTDKEVVKAMLPYFTEKYGNASSLHSFGREAKDAMEEARETIAKTINAKPSEIVFTSGGSESNNLAIRGIVNANRNRKNHIITTKIEHHAIHAPCEYLEKRGVKVTYLGVDKHGFVNPEDVKKALTKDTILVSVMHVNNELGTIEPIEKIGKICNENKIPFHTDAVQSVGKMPVDAKKLNVDFMSSSSHKLYGPKGVGFLFRKEGSAKIDPLIDGGGHEFGLRAGTENVAGIVGFAKACELAVKRMDKETAQLKKLNRSLTKGVLEIEKSYLNGPENRFPGISNFRFDYIEGESLILKLDMKGIAASTGSACSTKSLEPSHVLKAIGLSHVQAHGSLRLSLGKDNTQKDVDYVLEVLPGIVKDLRKISPLARK